MPRPSALSSRSLISLLLLGIALAACDKRSGEPEQANAAASGEATSGEVPPSASEDSAQAKYVIDRSKAGTALPDLAFTDAAGKTMPLARFKGKPLLVNLWATWCAPCVAEMPQLDRVAKGGFTVLAVSQDTMEAGKVMAFYSGKGFAHMVPALDPDNSFAFHYGTGMLPTSVLYDANGKEIARVSGAPDWESGEGKALLDEASGKK